VKQLAAVFVAAVLLAGSLAADRIAFIVGTGDERRIEHATNVRVTAWSAREVTYTGEDRRSNSIQHRNVFTLDRSGGSMSRELSRAIERIGADADAALELLAQVVESGSALDREEAGYWRLRILVDRAGASEAARNRAITEHQNYLRTYRAGYFAREVYTGLEELQRRAGRMDDARATLRSMSEAEGSMQRQAQQLLGELEAGAGNWQAAVTAFQAARNAATREQNKSGQYLAQAWEGWCRQRGEMSGARELLQAIVEDRAFEDPFSDDDDFALAIAYLALGDLHFDRGDFESAYNAYIRGAYHNWWIQSPREAHCLVRAFQCASNLEDGEGEWRQRRVALRSALASNFPRELQRLEQQR
jgi:tetratricopeptide (TPR) repeat protein